MTIGLRVTNDAGEEAFDTATINVQNAAPMVTLTDVPSEPVAVGAMVSVGGLFTDASTLDTHTATWTWGDGSTAAGVIGAGNVVTGSHSYAIPGTYSARLTVTDDDGGSQTKTFTVNVLAPAQATAFVVNAGAAQRSSLSELAVSFDQSLDFPALIASGAIVDAAQVVTTTGTPTVINLTPQHYAWNDAANHLAIDLTIDGFSGSLATLLADGRYELRLNAPMIQNAAGSPLADNDGTPDGVVRFAFHRLEGDFDGDAQVALSDRASWFNPAVVVIGAQTGQVGYNAAFDYDGDGIISSRDYYYWLRRLFGRRLD